VYISIKRAAETSKRLLKADTEGANTISLGNDNIQVICTTVYKNMRITEKQEKAWALINDSTIKRILNLM